MFNFRGEQGHKVEANDIMLAKRIGDTLHKMYPLHLWSVMVNSEGGVIDLKALNISSTYGIRMYYRDVADDPELKKIKMAAGELLERAGLTRGEWELGKKPTHLEGATFQDNLILSMGIIR